jgi:hypothetical protein
MTFVPHTKNKRCFTACPEHKIKSGLCDCINRMKFKGNDDIDAVMHCVCEKHDYSDILVEEIDNRCIPTCKKCLKPLRKHGA